MMHTPRYQSANGGRFIVCSCGNFRSGVGDARYAREMFADHLRLMTGASA